MLLLIHSLFGLYLPRRYLNFPIQFKQYFEKKLVDRYNFSMIFNQNLTRTKLLKLNLISPITDQLYDLALQRQEAKTAKNWELADSMRSQIQDKGFQIDDYNWGFGLWQRGN